ncbi:hypothetical protein C3F09_04395, partial [candidate division GN15 bacterium]
MKWREPLTWISASLTVAVLSPALSFGADTLRVDQVVADVLQHSDRLAAARYMEEAAKTKIGVAGAWD